ncbi:putative E3 ubiquitin-protein ligase UBR7 [Lampetra planeri]
MAANRGGTKRGLDEAGDDVKRPAVDEEEEEDDEEEEEDAVLSMMEVMQQNEDLESEADAVLGASDSDLCSYAKGYVSRQALYACSSCTPRGGEPAAICLACSYTCHEGHDLYELYTKRNFRCDCGNARFPGVACKLLPDKEASNPGNKYNHNFFGLYCTCKKPYPDPDDKTPDEMIQCIICEDWLHGRHLGVEAPESVEYHEMVCGGCMARCSFLWAYAVPSAVVKLVNEEHEGSLVVDDSPCRSSAEVTSPSGVAREDGVKPSPGDEDRNEESEAAAAVPKEESRDGAPSPGENGTGAAERRPPCLLSELRAGAVPTSQPPGGAAATFWPQQWRCKLCSCASCKAMYDELGVRFLLDEADTVQAYEARGKLGADSVGGGGGGGRAAGSSAGGGDPLMAALGTMNRVQQVELISEYNDLKTELMDYLKHFADEGKVVKKEDITEFFQSMQSRKRRRSESNHMAYHCK